MQSILSRALCVAVLTSTTIASSAMAAGSLNLYTTREPGLIKPLLEQFTAHSGIKVNTVFVKDGLLERVKAEGVRSPADMLMVVDIGNLLDLVEGGVTQPVHSKILKATIPANLRGQKDNWFALSMRARVFYADKNQKFPAMTYEDLANPKYKGKVCIRSGQHPYNTALFAAMLKHNGKAKTEAWLRGVKSNLARKAAGGDRNVARDILGGICDVGPANSYYVGRMKAAKPDSKNRMWGDAIQVIKPTFANGKGTHVNISGAAIAKHAPNRKAAVQLLEFLVSPQAQQMYARANYEYPVRKGVPLDPIIASSIGEISIDDTPLVDIAKRRKKASMLVDKVQFDQ